MTRPFASFVTFQPHLNDPPSSSTYGNRCIHLRRGLSRRQRMTLYLGQPGLPLYLGPKHRAGLSGIELGYVALSWVTWHAVQLGAQTRGQGEVTTPRRPLLRANALFLLLKILPSSLSFIAECLFVCYVIGPV